MEKQPLNWKQIMATALITGLVTIGTGMILFMLQQRTPHLVYSVADTIPFDGQQEKLAIYHVTLRNDGKRQVENVACNIAVNPAVIKTYKIQADATLKYNVKETNDTLSIEAASLNRDEAMTVSILVSSQTSVSAQPAVALRGKDVAGEKAKTGDKKRLFYGHESLFAALLAAYTGLASAIFLQRHRFAKIFPFLPMAIAAGFDVDDSHHSGDQNEVIAYLFGLHGLHEQVEYYLRKAEGCSYWSESDRIASLAIHTEDVALREKCVIILTDLLTYASFAPSSKGIIHYNLARIGRKMGNKNETDRHLVEARKTIPRLLSTRLALDPLFKE